jgi:2,3-bisphosphoglycerate-independent phosphoglycerate mutase
MDFQTLTGLTQDADTKIVLLVLDGLGGLPREPDGPTELEAADTPNLDRLVQRSTCGLIEPVGAGITPGSGPGHLALFGYDPLRYTVGRGVLSALGIDFDLRPDDVAARGNFCTVDSEGRVTDRRAGRIGDDENAALCERLREIEVDGAELLVETVREYRLLLVLRGDGLAPDVADTDPQATGVEPHDPEPRSPDAEKTARIVAQFLEQARERLADQDRANMVLLRGFDQRPNWPRFGDTFALRAAAIADYPMYRGVARLVGMDVLQTEAGLDAHVETLKAHWGDFDFFFVHQKQPDSAGEDGDFERRVSLLEEADERLPRILDLEPDVLLVTGDHSTPAVLRQHSWHPVPALLWSKTARPDGTSAFSEAACRGGGLGPRLPATDLMSLALAHAMRLQKFGA